MQVATNFLEGNLRCAKFQLCNVSDRQVTESLNILKDNPTIKQMFTRGLPTDKQTVDIR